MTIGMVVALVKAFAPGADPAVIEQAVADWLDAHPEATTTVQDGSITEEKLASELAAKIGEIDTLSEAIKNQPEQRNTDASTADLDIVDPSGYVIARLKNGHIQTKKFDSASFEKMGIEYKVSSGVLMLSFGYTAENDAVVKMDVARANDLFDFSAFMLKPNGKPLEDCEQADFTNVWSSSTDMHSPFQFLAVNNPDGYYASESAPSYTGGNHLVEIDGVNVKSASSKYVYFFADGTPVTSGNGRCSKFEIRWANNVQAHNCVKADGTGRTSMIEYHDMVFDGVQFNEKVTLVPTEDIKMQFWEGFAFVSWGTTFDHARFIDGTNRGTFTSSDEDIKSGNKVTSGIVAWGDDHAIEMTVDTNVDLGKRTFYEYGQDAGAFISATKGYFHIIFKYTPFVEMNEGEGFQLNGSFRFLPVLN